jgi:hypothetical protein
VRDGACFAEFGLGASQPGDRFDDGIEFCEFLRERHKASLFDAGIELGLNGLPALDEAIEFG